MTVSKLATRSSGNAGQYSSRGGRKIDRFLVHHAATSNLDVVLSMMRTGSREVSSNYVISNTGEIISVVPEEYRAWTSASPAWDGRAITVEVINSKTGDPWPISAKAQEALSRLIADVATRYKFTPKRDGRNSTVIGHRELYTWFGESYATACPGGINLAAVTNRAAELTSSSGGKEVIPYKRKDRKKKSIKPKQTVWATAANGKRLNLVGVGGEYSITAHLYVDGLAEGDVVEIKLAWVKDGKTSWHYVDRHVADRHGMIRANAEFKNPVTSGYVVNFAAYAGVANKKTGTITVMDADAHCYYA